MCKVVSMKKSSPLSRRGNWRWVTEPQPLNPSSFLFLFSLYVGDQRMNSTFVLGPVNKFRSKTQGRSRSRKYIICSSSHLSSSLSQSLSLSFNSDYNFITLLCPSFHFKTDWAYVRYFLLGVVFFFHCNHAPQRYIMGTLSLGWRRSVPKHYSGVGEYYREFHNEWCWKPLRNRCKWVVPM